MTYVSEVLADSPAVYWRLGETSGTSAVDASGNGRHGTYTGGYTQGQTGLLVSEPAALSTRCAVGGNGYVNSGIGGSVTAFTLEAWCNKTSGTSNLHVVGRDSSISSERLFRLAVNGGVAETWLQKSGYKQVLGTTTLANNTTYHLAATWDGTTLRLYVNGVEEGSVAASGLGALDSSAVLSVGGTSGYGAFDGRIQEAAYYTTALSAARIAAHYAAGTTAAVTGIQLAGEHISALEQPIPDIHIGGQHIQALEQPVTDIQIAGEHLLTLVPIDSYSDISFPQIGQVQLRIGRLDVADATIAQIGQIQIRIGIAQETAAEPSLPCLGDYIVNPVRVWNALARNMV